MKILVFGGDERQIYAAAYFKEKGYDTSISGIDRRCLERFGAESIYTEETSGYDVAVFPLPFSRDGENINCPLSEKKHNAVSMLKSIDRECKVFAGLAGVFIKKAAKEFGLNMTDYYECDDFQIKNSVPTAEGAVNVFMNKSSLTVYKSRCTVVGCGKVGRCLADRLMALGAFVTVAARSKKDLAWAESFGMKSIPIDQLSEEGCSDDCVFNTVPCNVFGKSFVQKTSGYTIYVELASKPFGMSRENAELLGERYIPAPSLPGKYAPAAAGKIIAETVCKYI